MKHEEQITVTKSTVGVIVRTKNEAFCIAYRNAALMDWNEATKKYSGQLPTRAQAQIMCIYGDIINAALIEAGGERLNRWYWTNEERNANEGFCFFGGAEIKWVRNDQKTSWYYIRPITSIENNGKQIICN